jgi:Methyltransferase domain
VHIELDFDVFPEPRWGHGRPAHPRLYGLMDAERARYRQRLASFDMYRDDLARIAADEDPVTPDLPAWNNPWFSGLDAVALYGFLRAEHPRLYMEIGSGMSTKFARQAIKDGRLNTRIVSIDPMPRSDIDRLCDQVIRERLEATPSDTFADVQPGDIVFMDGSHRVFTNSDTVVFFLEILPALPPGVFVHVHDIFLPYDYPPDWSQRFYSEQYILAAMLAGGTRSLQIEMPCAFVSVDRPLRSLVQALWAKCAAAADHVGGSFWLKTLDWTPETSVAR